MRLRWPCWSLRNVSLVERQLVQMSRYELTASREEYVAAISALANRVETEGPEGVIRYSFYAGDDTAGLLIVCRDPEAWLAQHEMVAPMEEYQPFYETIRLVGLRFLGNLTQEMRAWLDERNVGHEYLGTLAAGFER